MCNCTVYGSFGPTDAATFLLLTLRRIAAKLAGKTLVEKILDAELSAFVAAPEEALTDNLNYGETILKMSCNGAPFSVIVLTLTRSQSNSGNLSITLIVRQYSLVKPAQFHSYQIQKHG